MQSRIGRYYLIVTYCLVVTLFSLKANQEAFCEHSSSTIPAESVTAAIHRSALYLATLVEDNGRLVYRINMDPAVKVKPRYNILRHAGAVYALALYGENSSEKRIPPILRKTGRFLLESSIDKLPQHPNLLAVWSDTKINYRDEARQAKLGGTGLGLVALVSIEKMMPGFVSKETLTKLGQFILFMQKSDGGFYSKYIPSEGGRNDDWTSLYYPGEAALGLIMLNEVAPSEVWIRSALNALIFLAQSRENSPNVPADHWALIATEKLLRIDSRMVQPRHNNLLAHHAWQITEAIKSEQILKSGSLYGGFTSDGRTTPTATRLEGLLASRSIFSKDNKKIGILDPVIHRGIDFLLRAQIKEGKFSGAYPRAIEKIAFVYPDADDFNRRATEIRIDYLQHALCALIQYKKMLKEGDRGH